MRARRAGASVAPRESARTRSDAARARGVVAFSSGNHAQGVALAAQLLGVPAVIVMPSDAPVSKLAATRGYGAEVVLYERDRMNRTEIAAAIARDRGAVLVPPYDDPAIIAGQGTVVRELIEDVAKVHLGVSALRETQQSNALDDEDAIELGVRAVHESRRVSR